MEIGEVFNKNKLTDLGLTYTGMTLLTDNGAKVYNGHDGWYKLVPQGDNFKYVGMLEMVE